MTHNHDNTQTSGFNGDGNTITRSSFTDCTINSSYIKRSTLTDCVLSKVEEVSRVTAQKSQFQDAAIIKRSDITASTIQSQSSICRSTIGKSVIQDKSTARRSTVTGTTISNSQLKRATLIDCVITECTIERCDFQGLVLKNGIWKRNELIGKIGKHDPVFIRNHGPRAGQPTSVRVGSAVPGSHPKSHARQGDTSPSYDNDSYTSEDSAIDCGDLPPPYKP